MPDDLIEALVAAGFRHDLGKARDWWQKAIGNFSAEYLAKSNNNSFSITASIKAIGTNSVRWSSRSKTNCINDHPHRDLILHLIAASLLKCAPALS
ncbi:MAG: hypothetical protein U0Y68_02820 [Blastocatellia bacterium]